MLFSMFSVGCRVYFTAVLAQLQITCITMYFTNNIGVTMSDYFRKSSQKFTKGSQTKIIIKADFSSILH